MNIGFIGTKKGLTELKLEYIISLLMKVDINAKFLVSDMSESDKQFKRALDNFGLGDNIHIYHYSCKLELIDYKTRASIFKSFKEMRQAIIQNSDYILFAPKENYTQEEFGSVNQSINYAKKENKDFKIILANGEFENWPNISHIPKALRKNLKHIPNHL